MPPSNPARSTPVRPAGWRLPFGLAIATLFLGSCAVQPGRVVPVETQVRENGVRVAADGAGEDAFIVPVTIEGEGPFLFLLDTGAGTTIVDQRLAARFPSAVSPVSNSFLLAGADRVPYGAVLGIERLGIGGAEFKSLSAVVFDLETISAAIGCQLDGILGFPLFRNCLLTLDYRLREVRIEEGRLPPADGRRIFACEGDGRRPAIPVQVGGKFVHAVIDTGFRGYMRLPESAISMEEEDLWMGRSTTIAGLAIKRYAPLAGPLQLGGFRLHLPVQAIAGIEEGAPLIGTRILRRFRLTFDQQSRRIRLDPLDVHGEGAPVDTGQGDSTGHPRP